MTIIQIYEVILVLFKVFKNNKCEVKKFVLIVLHFLFLLFLFYIFLNFSLQYNAAIQCNNFCPLIKSGSKKSSFDFLGFDKKIFVFNSILYWKQLNPVDITNHA